MTSVIIKMYFSDFGNNSMNFSGIFSQNAEGNPKEKETKNIF